MWTYSFSSWICLIVLASGFTVLWGLALKYDIEIVSNLKTKDRQNYII